MTMADDQSSTSMAQNQTGADITRGVGREVNSFGDPVGQAHPARRRQDFHTPAWPVYFAAFVVSILWIGGPIAFAIGYRSKVVPFENDTFAMAVFALLSLGPAAFVWIAAYVLRQGQRLGAETRRAQSLADELSVPALTAAGRTGDLITTVREEITRAAEAAEEARSTLLALRQALAMETERLTDAAAGSVRTAQGLATTLGLERTEMGALAQTLDAQAMRVTDAISQQARMVAEASDLAETQLREAEAVLAARASDLAAAASEVSDAARTAGEDLNRHVARLEHAGTGVSEQIQTVEGGLTAQRTALVTLADALRADHAGFANEADVHATQLAEFITQARVSAAEMADRAHKGGEMLRAMVIEAAEQFRRLTEGFDAEREQIGQAVAQVAGQITQATTQAAGQITNATNQAAGRIAETSNLASGRLSELGEQLSGRIAESTSAIAARLAESGEQAVGQFTAASNLAASRISEIGAQTASQISEATAKAAGQLSDASLHAAGQLTEVSSRAMGQVSEASTLAAGQFSEVSSQAAGLISNASALERARLETETRAAIDALTRAASETREAAAAHAEAARQQVEQLSELAFGAGQTANKAYESRLDEARALIEKSAELIDEAGVTTAQRLEEGATAARNALEEMQRMLSEVEARTAALPDAARSQAEQVRAAVTGSMDELLGQARRAAAETQAIDDAFQGRVRRNYEVLSEAVRLMGSVAAGGSVAPLAAEPPPVWHSPPPSPPPPPPPPPPTPTPLESAPLVDVPIQLEQQGPIMAPASEPAQPPEQQAKGGFFGLRPRLKLTPTSTDEEVASIFDASPPKAEENMEGEGWSWKDLLSSIDEAEGGDPNELQAALSREISAMGIDAQAMLSIAKIDELAVVLQNRDFNGAREVVRALAPAANRRLGRRLFTDEKLKRRTLTFIGRFRGAMAQAAERDPAGFELAEQLNTEAGRTYLILDAAVGDIT